MELNLSRDRLDGSDKKHLVVEVILLPGRILLWLSYMFPGKGYGKVRQTARHARSPIMTIAYSIMFWVFIIYFVVNGGI